MSIEKIIMVLKRVSLGDWSRNFSFLFLGASMALFYSGKILQLLDNLPMIFLYSLILYPLLWGGLYGINDLTDRAQDLYCKNKRNRLIPSGKISCREALVGSVILIAAGLLASFLFAPILFSFLVSLMVLNQIFYTVKPFRLKEKFPLDIFSGGVVNHLMRFVCGWILFAPIFGLPILFLFLIGGFEYGFCLLYRMSNVSVEKKFCYKGTATKFGRKLLNLIVLFSFTIAIISLLLLVLNSIYYFEGLGFLPFSILVYSLLFSVPILIFWQCKLRDITKVDLNSQYLSLCGFHFSFIIGFVGILYLGI